MVRSVRLDAVLIQAVIAGALSFAHLHDLAEAAHQSGWKAWAYPVSVDLLMVAAWRRLRTARRDRAAWTWFVIALTASLGANVATAGLLDLHHVPAWLRILVAGWPALAFLGGTLLAHAPSVTAPAPEPRPAPVVDRPETPTWHRPRHRRSIHRSPHRPCRRRPRPCPGAGRPRPEDRDRAPHPHRYRDRHRHPARPPRRPRGPRRGDRRPTRLTHKEVQPCPARTASST